MAKSKKTLKRGTKLKSRGKRKMHNTKKHSKNYINIDNTGLTKVIYTEGNKSPKKTVFKWDGKYDGKNANIHMNLNVDGKKTQSDLKLSNNELMKILGANVVDKPIDQRLESLDENVSNLYSESPIMILSQEPQMMMQSSSNVPVFVNEMPMTMPMSMPMSMPIKEEQIMIVASPSPKQNKGNKSNKGKKGKSKIS